MSGFSSESLTWPKAWLTVSILAESPFLRCDSAVIIVCVFGPAVAGLKYMGKVLILPTVIKVFW